MNYASVSQARNRIPELAESAGSTVLTHNGEPIAVLVPMREYRALRAMLNLASQPERWQAVMADHARVQRGDLDDFVDEASRDDAPAVQQQPL